MIKKITIFLTILLWSQTLLAANFQPKFSGYEKVGPTLKAKWVQAMNNGDLLERVRCIIRVDKPADEKMLKDLKSAGFAPKTVLKTIITGSMEVGSLPIVAAEEVVASVDMPKRVHFKKSLGLK